MFENDSGCSIILDCGCGCCSLSAPQTLYASGSELVTVNAQHDMNFHAASRMTVAESELRNVKQFISNYAGYIGIAMNRIGTQLGLVDEYGKQVPFSTLAALIISYLKPRCIVLPSNADRLLVDAFNDIDRTDDDTQSEDIRIVFTDTDIGEVCNAMAENNSDLGFYDGYIIYGNGVAYPDAIVTSKVIARIATEHNISNLVGSITPYDIQTTKGSFECDILDFETAFPFCVDKYEDWNLLSFRSGWRIDMKDGWMYVEKPSKENNSVNVIAGSKDKAYLIGMIDVMKEIIAYCSWGNSRAEDQE
jgi:phosphoglucosamine mutase